MSDIEIQTLIQDGNLLDTPEPDASSYIVPTPEERRDHVRALVGAGVVVAVVVMGGVSLGWNTAPTPAVAGNQIQQVVAIVDTPSQPSTPNPYTTLALKGKAFVVYDVRADRQLFAHNPAEPRPLASLTKIMTSLVAVESADMKTRLAISDYAIDTEGDSGLFANETWKLGDLISFTMLTSSNDGADAIATVVGGLFETTPKTAPAYEQADTFVEHMNTRAQELKLVHTSYRNATGLDEPNGGEGGVGSAEDMAKLLAYTWEHAPEAVAGTTQRTHTYVSEDGFTHVGENTNEYVYTTPGMLASKTGYTDNAGGNLAILYNSGLDHPIAIVVLGSTVDGRFTDVQQLVDATYKYIKSGWYAYEVAGSSRESL
ncbi:MAG: D-alanyl-D-alanine carboxypeptidase [Candidatus Pacebacteria bacterium]|nr:D-alanyl-D-alanine carboxypeptidase [Candidatus Paceibacterota bacterium]